jgi:hypothetical protein
MTGSPDDVTDGDGAALTDGAALAAAGGRTGEASAAPLVGVPKDGSGPTGPPPHSWLGSLARMHGAATPTPDAGEVASGTDGSAAALAMAAEGLPAEGLPAEAPVPVAASALQAPSTTPSSATIEMTVAARAEVRRRSVGWLGSR